MLGYATSLLTCLEKYKWMVPDSYIVLQDAFARSRKFSDGKTFVPCKLNVNRVFTNAQEDHIVEYAVKIAKMFYGLPIREFCRVSYAYAEACNSRAIPCVWVRKGAATRDWYYAFMKRHPHLTLKTAEGMSIKRAMAFNRVSVRIFFEAYAEALARYSFTPDRIFNMDESGLSTVMKPLKVVCERGRPVASQVTQERGSHMTFVGFINAAGHYIPPVFLIARKKMKPEFMRGAIDGAKGLANQTGWMTGEMFLETLKHVREKTYCSLDNKILLIMDNAMCHMNINAVEYAIKNGIVIVTLPPHTTAKLQPLDVSIYGPFKTYLRALQNEYRLANPNRPITEYMLPEFASKAWIKACTPSNVLSGFAATGIWPLNSDIFSDDAFAGAEVTERESPQDRDAEQSLVSAVEGNSSLPGHSDDPTDPTPGPSSAPEVSVAPGPSSRSDTPASPVPGPSSAPDRPVTPESVRPYPKAANRPRGRGRPSLKACILTENPEAINMLKEKEKKKKMAEDKKKGQPTKKKQGSKRKREVEDSTSEEEDIDDPPVLDDSSDYTDEELEPEEVVETETTYPFVQKELEVRGFLFPSIA